MNAKHPRRHPLPLLLFACLSLALLAPCMLAQRRRQAPPAARKPAANKPAPTPAPARVEPTPQAPTSGRRALIRWRGRTGIDRYRLQVARDRNFSDIVFDRAVMGFEAEVELPQGDGFFWRVAPAAQETGEYSAPEPVVLSTATSSVLRSARDVGWQALVGEVLRPQPAPLRSTGAFDVVAVNAEGTVFALDGANGSALWTARYRPNARRDDPPKSPANIFTPVVIPVAEGGKANVVAAFDGGVRALEGESGRELWRVTLSGAPLGGTVADLDDDKVLAELAIVTDEPALHFIDARTGRVNAKEKLDGAL
ncbi:MAG TPA: PQQ-binding-like beta-propeller repeat protein, partial [Pyrinomonadaceae bacterium]|nr:PQQ-binding-like beta-propeller repeat protein [Pyrinomonadaceae bacterium]